MRFKWLSDYWAGVLLLAGILVASLWLASQGKLDLYVHPRYIPFTITLCVMGVLFLVGDAFMRKKPPKILAARRPLQAVIPVLCVALCLGILVMRPSSLTSLAAEQRGVNSGALTLSTTSSVADLSNSSTAFEQFSVKEWASLLAQTKDTALFKNKPAHIIGFVSPAPDGNTNVFYVSRFVITCCAVDARPIGVPVYQPGWQSSYKADQWLDVRGAFTQNPEGASIPNVLEPKEVTKIDEPADPYVH